MKLILEKMLYQMVFEYLDGMNVKVGNFIEVHKNPSEKIQPP